MNPKLKHQEVPCLSDRAQSWVGLPANAFGGVGDSTSPRRAISEVRAEQERLRAEYRASRG